MDRANCVPRALSHATGLDLAGVTAILAILGRKRGCKTNTRISNQAVEMYGGKWIQFKRGTTIGAIAKRYPRSTVVAGTSTHMTCIVNGVIFDSTGAKCRCTGAWLMPAKLPALPATTPIGSESAVD